MPPPRGIVSITGHTICHILFVLNVFRGQKMNDLSAVQSPVHRLSALLVTSNLHDVLDRLEAAPVYPKKCTPYPRGMV
eukprot:scaffold7232_cov63-Cyclotella_meneghiniana.AAC.11